MWPRMVEIVLALWLAGGLPLLSGDNGPPFRTHDLIVAAVVIAIALLSFHPRLRRLYLAQIAVGMWLVGYGFLAAEPPAPPELQNAVLVGLVLMMFGIIPNEANQPPRSWRQMNENASAGKS